MNILTAIFAGQTGFTKATQSMAARAARVAADTSMDDQVVEDLIGMKVDRSMANANLRTVKVADNLMSEFIRETLKK